MGSLAIGIEASICVGRLRFVWVLIVSMFFFFFFCLKMVDFDLRECEFVYVKFCVFLLAFSVGL